MTHHLHQPDIDPVLIHLWSPFQIRWYSLLYVGGFIVGRYILLRLSKEKRFQMTRQDVEQFVMWLLIGAVVGARIIYCIFYDPKNLLSDPFFLFKIYEGGLSFHGGLLGVITVALVFSRKKKIPFWNLADAFALATPPGLAMGRLGNFINGELFGRVSDVPWAIIFKRGGFQARHPSQLYEFFLEGVLLFALLWFLKPKLRRDGEISVAFLIFYSLFRFIVEFFREPDPQLGYLVLGLSMGQLLSLAMFLISSSVGVWLFVYQRSSGRLSPERRKKKA